MSELHPVVTRFAATPLAPASQFLGFKVIGFDAETATLTAQFHATTQMMNAIQVVQGGFVTAMLDLAMSAAAFAVSDFRIGIPTLEMKTTFLQATKPGKLTCEGRVLRMGKSVVFLEGKLFDARGELLAVASSTTRRFDRTDQNGF